MSEPSSEKILDITNTLFEVIPLLMQRVRAELPHDSDEIAPEWRDLLELRATKGQFTFLRVLMTRQQYTMQELAEQLEVAPPAITAMVKRLLAQGFVARTRDEQDWRVVQISLTERGQRVVALYEDFWRTHLYHLLSHLSEEELMHLREALPALRHLVSKNFE
jgi:MarR family transcriptional regulator, organic hydroperoxide resistance regulator